MNDERNNFDKFKHRMDDRETILKSMKHQCCICKKIFTIDEVVAKINDDCSSMVYYCKPCLRRYKIKTPKDNINIVLEPLTVNIARSYYDNLKGYIVIKGEKDDVSTIYTLSHEYIHAILHKLIGFESTVQFDNIAYIAADYNQLDISYGYIEEE
jgi:Zn-dependent peptidase ImmA (M78 family)